MTDDLPLRRRRAAYRASHRGTKEMDVMIGRYADAALAGMAGGALELFERLLALPDPTLNAWLLAPGAEIDSEFAPLIADVRRFHGLGADTDEPEQT